MKSDTFEKGGLWAGDKRFQVINAALTLLFLDGRHAALKKRMSPFNPLSYNVFVLVLDLFLPVGFCPKRYTFYFLLFFVLYYYNIIFMQSKN